MVFVVSLIPARGGSKGIPRKNIKILNGKPLIAHTIEASLQAKSITRTIVSTDDKDIANISKEFGAEVPFLRPDNISGDDILDFPVIKHFLEYLDIVEQIQPDILVFLRPTMPTRTAKEIDEVINLLIQNEKADCIRTTRPAVYPPFWMKKINGSGYLEPYDDHVIPFCMKRRQDLPNVVMCDGYVDAARVESILANKSFPTGKQIAFYRENITFLDIDTPEDWNFCEYYMGEGDIS